MAKKCFIPIVARYSKEEADNLLKKLKDSPKLSIQDKKPVYRISKERYKGKETDRWIISQDCNSLNKQRRASGF